MDVKNLKLIARTEEDLRVVSAHLQDAIANIADIANLEKNKIFLLQLNRFMWEDVEKGVFRKNKRIPKFENSHDFDIFSVLKNTDIDIENKMIKDQIHSEVKKIIEFLPDDQKEVLKYRYYNDLSFKEISEKTGVSINTSLGRMRYALINLRNIIKDKNIILTN